MADVLAGGYDSIITSGGAQSNHCRCNGSVAAGCKIADHVTACCADAKSCANPQFAAQGSGGSRAVPGTGGPPGAAA